MRHPQLDTLLRWFKTHPGIFSFREEGNDLFVLEIFSGKSLQFLGSDLERLEERSNSTNPGETYVVALLNSGRQIVCSPQGFAFPPDFSGTGPLPLPNQVYCMQDYQNLMSRLRHVAAEEGRGREALEIILVLIAILDGARLAGLDIDAEAGEVDEILTKLEKGETLPPPHET